MDFYMKMVASVGVLILIMCCVMRQRRYWRELQESRPSGSIKAGYQLATAAIVGTLVFALISNTDSSWQLFIGVLLVALAFCVKITFSPTVIALTLAVCIVQLHTTDEFPLLTVWGGFISALTWRLPEEFRIFYAYISFLWIFVATVSGSHPEAAGAELPMDGVADTLSSLHA